MIQNNVSSIFSQLILDHLQREKLKSLLLTMAENQERSEKVNDIIFAIVKNLINVNKSFPGGLEGIQICLLSQCHFYIYMCHYIIFVGKYSFLPHESM